MAPRWRRTSTSANTATATAMPSTATRRPLCSEAASAGARARQPRQACVVFTHPVAGLPTRLSAIEMYLGLKAWQWPAQRFRAPRPHEQTRHDEENVAPLVSGGIILAVLGSPQLFLGGWVSGARAVAGLRGSGATPACGTPARGEVAWGRGRGRGRGRGQGRLLATPRRKELDDLPNRPNMRASRHKPTSARRPCSVRAALARMRAGRTWGRDAAARG